MGCGSSALVGSLKPVAKPRERRAAESESAIMSAEGSSGEDSLGPAAKRSRSSAAGAPAAAIEIPAEPVDELSLLPQRSQDSPRSDPDRATLWVGSIPDSLLLDTDGIKKAETELRRVFFAHGVVTAVSVRKKDVGANKSWAFVTFASADSVQKAVRNENFVTCPDGSRAKLTVKVADVQAQIKKRAATPDAGSPPVGAMEKMWDAQHKQVVRGLRTPMQDILESLQDIAATVPSVAGQIEHVTAILTSTEDLWSIELGGAGSDSGKRLGSGSFRDVEDEDVKSYLRSHQNLQLQESHAYSQELTRRRRYQETGRRMAVLPDGVIDSSNTDEASKPDDVGARVSRVLPEISDEARMELVKWESKIDSWDFDIFRVSELTNGAPLAFVMFTVFSRYDLLNKLKLEER